MGPGFWKIKSPIFGFDKNISLTRYSMHSNIFNSNNLSLDNRYVNLSLSSRDMFNKEIAIAWSENIYQNAVNHMKVPRIFFSQLPDDLDTYKIKKRKTLFISIILPLLIKGNEKVLKERKLIQTHFVNKDFEKIKNFCKKYKIKDECNLKPNLSIKKIKKLKDNLMIKINVYPLSMMLAQAAIESGWGMSRFAKKGNALFGQWTWSTNNGIKPKENLNAKFAVKSFKNLQESVNAYILNLNTHEAYKKLRQYRYLMTKNKKDFVGINFAKYLDKYAEIGYQYVAKVISLIKTNRLENFNNLKFKKALS